MKLLKNSLINTDTRRLTSDTITGRGTDTNRSTRQSQGITEVLLKSTTTNNRILPKTENFKTESYH